MASAGSFKDAGNAAFKQGDHAAALVAYTRSIELDPSEFALYLNRSITFLKLKRWEEAEKDASTALRLKPTSAKASFRRSVARRELGLYAAARKDLMHAKENGASVDEVRTEMERLVGLEEKVQQKQKTPVSVAPAPASTPAVSSPATSASVQTPSSSRLVKALSPPSPLTVPASTSSSSGFIKEVSTRRLTPKPSKTHDGSAKEAKDSTTTKAASSFAQQKEKREERAMFSASVLRAASTSSVPKETRWSVVEDEDVLLERAKREVAAASGMGSSDVIGMAIGKGKEIEPVRRSEPITTMLGFEAAWDALLSSTDRRNFLRSLDPATLPTLFGDNLTPEILESIIGSLLVDDAEEFAPGKPQRDWYIPLLRGIANVRRFSMVVGFLGSSEKEALKTIMEQARKEIEQLGVLYEM